jgi:hypothetical protein
VVNFDLNWADINDGQRGTAPAVRVTLAGPDGTPMIAANPGPGGSGITCQSVQSFRLGGEGPGSQLVQGLSLRVPLHTSLTHLLLTAGGRTVSVPLVTACEAPGAGRDCFPADELGGPWTAGAPYSISLRV